MRSEEGLIGSLSLLTVDRTLVRCSLLRFLRFRIARVGLPVIWPLKVLLLVCRAAYRFHQYHIFDISRYYVFVQTR